VTGITLLKVQIGPEWAHHGEPELFVTEAISLTRIRRTGNVWGPARRKELFLLGAYTLAFKSASTILGF